MEGISDFKNLFSAYQKTPCLWLGNLKGLQQFKIANTKQQFLISDEPPRLRLGKWVEEFAKHQITCNANYQLLADGLQIRRDKQTIGELDILFLRKSQPIHLELIYKFYLYDNIKTYDKALEYWIGPNRTDSLMLKINKLQSKQLPLLKHRITKSQLIELGLPSEGYHQKVQFKAQLFVPLKSPQQHNGPLNKNCICGFYINQREIHQFKAFEFYIPQKLDWILEPQLNVNWLPFSVASKTIEDQCHSHRSPMIWLKGPENHLQKAFVTWW